MAETKRVSRAGGWSRREFLRLGGAGLLGGMGLLGAAGCGGDSSDGVTLRYGIWDQTQLPAMRQIVEAFTQQNPGVTVEIELTPYDDYLTKYEGAAEGGTLPDVFWMEPIWFRLFAGNEIISPITDQISEAGVDLAAYPQQVVQYFELGGDNYALPKDFDTIGLWYNEKLFDAAGVPYPDETWDWQTFTDAAIELTDSSSGVFGTAAPLDPQQGHWNTIHQAGGSIIIPDGGALRSGYGEPEAVDGVKFWTDLILEHQASPTLAQMTETEPYLSFFSGKIAMIFLGSWNAVLLKEEDQAVAEAVNAAVLPQGARRATMTNGLGNVIAANSEYPEEAWQLSRFLGGQEAARIQARTGAVIPAIQGTQQAWVDSYPDFAARVFVDQVQDAVPVPISDDVAKWQQVELERLREAWLGEVDPEAACAQLAQEMDVLLAEEREG